MEDIEIKIEDNNTDPKYYGKTRNELYQLCKERKIKYSFAMNKKEMFEVLEMNDNDNNIIAHPSAQKRITEYANKYRDNEEQREKARECSRR